MLPSMAVAPPRRRNAPSARPIDPMPGLWLTSLLSWPYLSDRLASFPRSTGHDVVFGTVVALIWGTAFVWDALGRKLPLLRTLIRLAIALAVWSAVAALYGTIIYLLITT